MRARCTCNLKVGLAATKDWAASLTENPRLRSEKQQRGFVSYLRLVSSHLWNVKSFEREAHGPFLRELIEVGTALVMGVIIELELGAASVAELDLLDFREWLCGMGAQREAVYGSSLVQALYDAPFEYCGGDKRRPSFAPAPRVRRVCDFLAVIEARSLTSPGPASARSWSRRFTKCCATGVSASSFFISSLE